MNESIKLPRRDLIKSVTAGAVGLAMTQSAVASQPNKKVRLGVIGLGRGKAHIETFSQSPGVEIAYVCDVDSNRLASGLKSASAHQQHAKVKGVDDFRRILDDDSIDAVSIAAPNFWHAPAAILACDAGKHVYVEKPGSHSMFESQLLIQAAKQHRRHVQLGVQRRSMPHYMEAVRRLHAGEIGARLYARCWYDSNRGSIGTGKQAAVPAWLDYELWQGPVPRQPYKDNLVHYNWHWRWNTGNGELGNNGIHALDVARWGMKVDLPKQVSYTGSRFHFQDDQQTPDTGYAVYEFEDCGISWEQSSCLRRRPENHSFVTFYGSEKTLDLNNNGYTLYDPAGKKLEEVVGSDAQLPHFQNFIDAIRDEAKLNGEIADTQISTQLCHLGNISNRLGQMLKVDVADGVTQPSDAMRPFWQREYESGWKPKV